MPPARLTAVAAVVLLGVGLAACTGGGDDAPTADTEAPVVETPPAVDTVAVEDPELLERILADDVVTADELAAGYEAYVECLADGGGYGRYAYDVSLGAALTVDWRVDDDPDGRRSTALDAGCSDAYLARLQGTYDGATTEPDDLAERQRDSIVACVEAVSPEIAAAIPDDITTDTSGGGLYIGDPQLDAAFLGADAEQTEAVGLCFSTIGAEWHAFGNPPPDDSTPPTTD